MLKGKKVGERRWRKPIKNNPEQARLNILYTIQLQDDKYLNMKNLFKQANIVYKSSWMFKKLQTNS